MRALGRGPGFAVRRPVRYQRARVRTSRVHARRPGRGTARAGHAEPDRSKPEKEQSRRAGLRSARRLSRKAGVMRNPLANIAASPKENLMVRPVAANVVRISVDQMPLLLRRLEGVLAKERLYAQSPHVRSQEMSGPSSDAARGLSLTQHGRRSLRQGDGWLFSRHQIVSPTVRKWM